MDIYPRFSFYSRRYGFIPIKTFKSIQFIDGNKPLVICDIDHTFIRCSQNLEHYRQILYKDFENSRGAIRYRMTHDDNKKALQFLMQSYNLGFMKQTDPSGFNDMITKIENLGGKLVFLTSRGILSHQKTIEDLKKVGLEDPEKYDIHYTNSQMSKGEYIRQTNLIDGYQHISFIDDYVPFLESVKEIYPHINCYLFQCY